MNTSRLNKATQLVRAKKSEVQGHHHRFFVPYTLSLRHKTCSAGNLSAAVISHPTLYIAVQVCAPSNDVLPVVIRGHPELTVCVTEENRIGSSCCLATCLLSEMSPPFAAMRLAPMLVLLEVSLLKIRQPGLMHSVEHKMASFPAMNLPCAMNSDRHPLECLQKGQPYEVVLQGASLAFPGRSNSAWCQGSSLATKFLLPSSQTQGLSPLECGSTQVQLVEVLRISAVLLAQCCQAFLASCLSWPTVVLGLVLDGPLVCSKASLQAAAA